MDINGSHRPNGSSGGGDHDAFYRRGSNMSDASFMQDVDMAQDEMFSGPMSESVPTSNTGFAHRRSRADSTTSFTYYEEDQEYSSDSWLEEEAIIEEPEYEDSIESQNGATEHDGDVESGLRRPSKRRKSSGYSRTSRQSVSSKRSRTSSDDPLLRRHDSTGSAGSNVSGRWGKDRVSQKIYIQSEDLTIAIAGFKTSILGFALYITLCICTAGIGYLIFRWLPRWRIRLVGSAAPLRDCQWVVVEVLASMSVGA